MLRGLVLLAWAALVLAVLTPLSIQAMTTGIWPEGIFSLVYNVVVIEFGVVTLALTVLLFSSSWYERIPRSSTNRVFSLLVAVIVWFSLHLFAAFHVTGGFGGPFMPLLLVLLMASLTAFPGVVGWLVAAYLALGHMGVLWLADHGLISHEGTLGAIFSLTPPLTNWSLTALACVLLLCLLLAITLRRWLYPETLSISPAQRIDPGTGLFRRVFLEYRMERELKRIKRQGGSVSLLLIGRDKKEWHRVKKDITGAMIEQVRLSSDTPASYLPGVIAVLLPDAGRAVIDDVTRRIVEAASLAGGMPLSMRAAVAVAESGELSVADLKACAEEALSKAAAGLRPVVAHATARSATTHQVERIYQPVPAGFISV